MQNITSRKNSYLKIALLQLLPGNDMADQLRIGKAACERAKELGADIALFPEMWSTGYRIPQDARVLNETADSCRRSGGWPRSCKWR